MLLKEIHPSGNHKVSGLFRSPKHKETIIGIPLHFKCRLISCHIVLVMDSVNHLDGWNNVFSHIESLNTGIVISDASLKAFLRAIVSYCCLFYYPFTFSTLHKIQRIQKYDVWLKSKRPDPWKPPPFFVDFCFFSRDGWMDFTFWSFILGASLQ